MIIQAKSLGKYIAKGIAKIKVAQAQAPGSISKNRYNPCLDIKP